MCARVATVLLFSSVAGAQTEFPQRGRVPPRPANVLVIVLDDVGTDQLACYGEAPPVTWSCDASTPAPDGTIYARTPFITGLSDSGIRFTNAYGMPLCSPSRACIQTGRYSFRTGIGTAIDSDMVLPEDVPLNVVSNGEIFIPEVLRAGFPRAAHSARLPYRCGAFGKWHLTTPSDDDNCSTAPTTPPHCSTGDAHEHHPVQNGYDAFYGTIDNHRTSYCWTQVRHDRDEPCGLGSDISAGSCTPPCYDEDHWDATITRRDAVAWINAQSHVFFAYVAFNAPHVPLHLPPLELLDKDTRDELDCVHATIGGPNPAGRGLEPDDDLAKKKLYYRATLEAVDREIGNLLLGIDAEKLANTMIFVVGDNGTPGFPTAFINEPYSPDHSKGTVYQGGIRVPLIVAGPMVTTPGSVSPGLVHVVDQRIAEVAGASVDLALARLGASGIEIDSLSFKPLIESPAATSARTSVFAQRFDPNGPTPACVTHHSRALIKRNDADGKLYKLIRPYDSTTKICYMGLVPPPECTDCPEHAYVDMLFCLTDDADEQDDILSHVPPDWDEAFLAELRSDLVSLSGP